MLLIVIKRRKQNWDSEKIQTFLNNFDVDNITNLCMQMDHLKSNGDADQGDINQIFNSINDMYITNCRNSFGVTSKGSKQPAQATGCNWFNRNCKIARSKFLDSDLQLLFTISMHVYTKAYRMCHTASVPSVY